MRAVQITRFGGPEVLDVVDLPDPTPGEGQQLFDVSTAGVNYADTHQTEDGTVVTTDYPPLKESLSTSVLPGRMARGKIAFDVPEGTTIHRLEPHVRWPDGELEAH
jgi:NADPH:quinone reductase